MKISVTREGRDNVWIPDPDSLIAWIKEQKFKQIHNFLTSSSVVIGADHDVKYVIEDIRSAERLALTTDDVWAANFCHALSVIKDNELQLYDIGEITESDLEV